jgi:hypothetical protein
MHDKLDQDASAVLPNYLHARFGQQLASIPDGAPIWISYSRNKTHGQAIGIHTLSNIMLARLGTSKVHATLHPFAVGVLREGAPLTDVSERLGHSSIMVTQRYAKEVIGDENRYGGRLVGRFGIRPRKPVTPLRLAARRITTRLSVFALVSPTMAIFGRGLPTICINLPAPWKTPGESSFCRCSNGKCSFRTIQRQGNTGMQCSMASTYRRPIFAS